MPRPSGWFSPSPAGRDADIHDHTSGNEVLLKINSPCFATYTSPWFSPAIPEKRVMGYLGSCWKQQRHNSFPEVLLDTLQLYSTLQYRFAPKVQAALSKKSSAALENRLVFMRFLIGRYKLSRSLANHTRTDLGRTAAEVEESHGLSAPYTEGKTNRLVIGQMLAWVTIKILTCLTDVTQGRRYLDAHQEQNLITAAWRSWRGLQRLSRGVTLQHQHRYLCQPQARPFLLERLSNPLTCHQLLTWHHTPKLQILQRVVRCRNQMQMLLEPWGQRYCSCFDNAS